MNLNDEILSKIFFQNISISLQSYNLNYLIKEVDNKLHSICNLKYYGQEFFVYSDLQQNNHIEKISYIQKPKRKIRTRNLNLQIKELLVFTCDILIFSTLCVYQDHDFKKILENEEYLFLTFFFEDFNSVYYIGKERKIKSYPKKLNFISVFLLELNQTNIMGVYTRKEKYWFEFSIRRKSKILSNFTISMEIKKKIFFKKMYIINPIYILNFNSVVNFKNLFKLKQTIEWVSREVATGLIENDQISQKPTSLDSPFFIYKRIKNSNLSLDTVSLNCIFESLEAEFFNFPGKNDQRKFLKNWKQKTIGIETNFNKLIYRLINSIFKKNEGNFTTGADCSWKNFFIFGFFHTQKTKNEISNKFNKYKLSRSNNIEVFNFRKYSFSLGRSLNYSKL